MRTLRKAGLVAAMIGSLTLAGAGVASAYEGGGDNQDCTQTGEVNVGLVNISDLNLGLGFLGLGSANPDNSAQFSCVNGDGSGSVQVQGGDDGRHK
ncbi:hypothetical protein [Streptomyces sp. NBC_00582]|uniref:hypothetical protein n=1 Tax=Streptomyces sp. NBC_00582 TaxID=2975783 RepID=UPI00106437EB|nr:hypothetical protein [Streptomyces sp. NBC_00582]WUB60621.1 hypothetical protein OG852_09615 [Streptomyces sp. NBC_00582]